MIFMPTVLFRVDSSLEMGAGHVMRCLSLALAFKEEGVSSGFLSKAIIVEQRKYIESLGVPVTLLEGAAVEPSANTSDVYATWLGWSECVDAEKVLRVAQVYPDDVVLFVVDHYGIGKEWEDQVSERYAVLALDDLNNRKHSARWVLDQTYGKTPLSYQGLVSEQTHLLVGSDFALLNRKYRDAREDAVKRRESRQVIGSILISLGGAYNHQLCSRVVEQVKHCRRVRKITLVTGYGGKTYESILCSAMVGFPFEVYEFSNDLISLMEDADICIGAAGSSSLERCVLGVPSISIVIADNQKYIGEHLDKSGATRTLSLEQLMQTDQLTLLLDTMIEDPDILSRMSLAASTICDGNGAARVVRETLSALYA